METGISKVIR